MRLTFSSGRFVDLLYPALSGLGLPLFWFLGCLPRPSPLFFSLAVCRSACAPLVSFFLWFRAPDAFGLGALFFFPPPPPRPAMVFFSSFFFVLRPRCLWLSPAPGALGLAAVCCLFCPPPASRLRALALLLCFLPGRWLLPGGCSPPPCVVSCGFRCCRSVLVFFLCAPVVSGFLWFPAPGALGLGAVCCLFCRPPASRLSVRSRLFVFPARPLAAPWWLLPPPPFVSCGFRCCRSVLCFFFCSLAVLACSPPPAACVVPCAVCCCRAALPSCVACRAVVPHLAVLWAAARCAVLVGVFVCVLCCAVGCCCVLCPASAQAVRLGCSQCGCCLVLVCVAVCRAVLCAPGCGAAPRCCVSCLPVLCCCALCCFVALVWCCCLLCRVL